MNALYFLLPLAGLIVALGALAYWRRTYPHTALLLLALVPAALSAGLMISSLALWLVLTADALIVLFALIDLATLPAANELAVERRAGRVASLAKPHPLALTVTNRSVKPRSLVVKDGVPHELAPSPESFRLQLPPRSRSTLDYTIRAGRRGAFALERVYVRAFSRWSLWQRDLVYRADSTIHVYPDMKQLSQYAVLARTNRLSLLGVRRTRRIGQDNEFERLRDYTFDDNYKHLDWRSTARRGKLTVKDFQANQSQRIMFLLDCGRMMTNRAEGLSLLDHSLNAMLMLSYVALSRGDSVGLLAFSDEVHSYVPPHGGLVHMNRLLHASFDRFPRLVESRYDRAFLHLASHCRKRSLVILITNLIDEVNSHQIEQYLGNLVGQHLPLGVLLRDHRVFDFADVEHPQGADLYRAAAAADTLIWRHQVLTDLQSRGVLALDAFPEDLTAPLINRYLDIKARHLL